MEFISTINPRDWIFIGVTGLLWALWLKMFFKLILYILNGVSTKASVHNHWQIGSVSVCECAFEDDQQRKHQVEVVLRRKIKPLWVPKQLSIVYLPDNPQKVVEGSRFFLLFQLLTFVLFNSASTWLLLILAK